MPTEHTHGNIIRSTWQWTLCMAARHCLQDMTVGNMSGGSGTVCWHYKICMEPEDM